MQRDVETVVAYEDQEFLSKLQILLNKTATPSVKSVCQKQDIKKKDFFKIYF